MTTWVVASFLGSAFTVGLLYTLSSLYMQGKVDRLANTPKPKPTPVAEITRSVPAEKDWDKIVEDVARRSNAVNEDQPRQQQAQQPVKQTEYSTATYVPQALPNVIPSQRTYTQAAKPQQQNKKQEIVIIGKETRLRDFCPYREGSIERRNCKAQIGLQNR